MPVAYNPSRRWPAKNVRMIVSAACRLFDEGKASSLQCVSVQVSPVDPTTLANGESRGCPRAQVWSDDQLALLS